MGKRELLLIAAFVVIGVVVYQVSAPPADPSKRNWSFSGILNEIRREVRGNQGRAEVVTTTTVPVDARTREIRVLRHPLELTVVGEDRADVEYQLKVSSRAFDDAEAQETAKKTTLKVDQAGEVLSLEMLYPSGGRQSATLTLKVPRRLAVRIDEKVGKTTISEVAGVTIGTGRGVTVISNISGAVQATQRGSSIAITQVGALKLTTATAETRIRGVRGDATFLFQGGEIRAEELEGAIELEGRLNADINLDKLDKARGPVRVNVNGGEVLLRGLASDTRVDARRSEVRVEQAAPSTLAIYAEGEDPVEVTTADGGLTIDALTTGGRITLDDTLQKAGLTVVTKGAEGNGERQEARVEGPVRGGGPTITLRATRDITLRSR